MTSLAALLWLIGAPAAELSLPPAPPLTLDGRLEEDEWASAVSFPFVDGEAKGTIRLLRTGPWLALGVEMDRSYGGEILRLYVSEDSGAWTTAMYLGLAQPALPPALWRRGPAALLADARYLPEVPRGARLRVLADEPGSFSAEYLLRLGVLGIGRADLRRFRIRISLEHATTERRIFAWPATDRHLDPSTHARFTSTDGWGAAEAWRPPPVEASREFDDHELLYRLYLEHERVSQRERLDRLVITSAVRPRAMMKIDALKNEMLAGQRRNPTLPSWRYFLGRLANEANLFTEARERIDAIPAPLRGLDPFVNLRVEFLLDQQRWADALAVCEKHPRSRGVRESVRLALAGRRLQKAEDEARAVEAAKQEKNPRVRFVTEKGSFEVELFEDEAPHLVRNFMDLLLRHKYYDRLRFHEVKGGFFARFGDPRTRTGSTASLDGPEWKVRPDRASRPPLRGSLIAVPVDDAFHGSQLVIAFTPILRNPEDVVVFGRVAEGFEVFEALDQGDLIERVEILHKRNHNYDPLGVRTQ